MSNIKWTWPLKVFVGPSKARASLEQTGSVHIKEFMLLYPTRAMTRTIPWQLPKDSNLLILEDAGSTRSTLPVRTGILVLLVAAESDGSYKRSIQKWGDLMGLAMHYKASSIIFVDQLLLVNWMESLLVGLSKNSNFIAVIKGLKGTVKQIHNPLLNWDTPIFWACRQLLVRLANLPNNSILTLNEERRYDKIDFSSMLERWISKSDFGDRRAASWLKSFDHAITEAEDKYNKYDNLRVGWPYVDEESLNYELKDRNFKSIAVEINYRGSSDEDDVEWIGESVVRFLQCRITGSTYGQQALKYLEADREYQANIRIGNGGADFISANQIFQQDEVFKDLPGSSEGIEIQFQPEGQVLQQRSLMLSRWGNSMEVAFNFKTPEDSLFFKADIKAFHKNRLIQWAKLSLVCQDNLDGFEEPSLAVVDAPRRNLSDLKVRSTFATSLAIEDKGEELSISGISENRPLRFNSSEGLKVIVNAIKNTISSAATNNVDFPEELMHPANAVLFRKLAFQGNSLYTKFFQDKAIPSPIQVCANRADFIPIGFTYELNPPSMDASLCSNAVQALKAGKCLNCFDKTAQPSPRICPFGFWGLSKVIEYHKSPPADIDFGSGDFLTTSEPTYSRNKLEVFKKTIHGSAGRMEFGAEGLREELFNKIKTLSPASMADTWEDWKRLTLEERPDSIVLVVHVEKDEELEVDKMEIGNGQFLIQNYLNENYIAKEINPIAIVIGCEASAIDNQGFDLGSEFMVKGASMVITNFTKILGPHAAKIVERLIEFFESYKGQEVNFGEIMLKAKQSLLADGLLVSMALVSYGDADWKLKI